MSGVGINWTFGNLPEVQLRIDQILHADMRGLMDSIGAEVVTQTQRRIHDEKTTPKGEPWAPWSDRYAKTRTSGQSLLESEGHFVQSITHIVEGTGKEVDIGSNLVQAKMLNFGGAKIGKPGFPAREWLGLSESNRIDVAMVASKWLDSHLLGGLV